MFFVWPMRAVEYFTALACHVHARWRRDFRPCEGGGGLVPRPLGHHICQALSPSEHWFCVRDCGTVSAGMHTSRMGEEGQYVAGVATAPACGPPLPASWCPRNCTTTLITP